MKSLIYLVNILVSFFFLLIVGIVSGGAVFSLFGEAGILGGDTAGAIAGICGWFKLVGFIVEKENVGLIEKKPEKIAQTSPLPQTGVFLSARDARMGNHLMIGGIITFLSSLMNFSNLNLILGIGGVGVMVFGFVVSVAAYEFPAEEGVVRRAKLLIGKLTK